MTSRPMTLMLALLAFAVGCDDDDDEDSRGSAAYVLSGETAKDEKIASDLDRYLGYNYGRLQEPDPELTEEEGERLGPLADNALGLPTSIEGISVSDSVITIETNLDEGEESTTTAELICTVIYGADVADHVKGHSVIAPDGSALATCTHDTSPYESTSLSATAQRLVESAFRGIGASMSETICAVETFTQRVGVDEINAAAAEFKADNTSRFMSYGLDLAAADKACDVDDHRQVKDCGDPKDEDGRLLCHELERLTQNAPGS